MYMIAFVTLVVALIGAYAQVWTLQTRNLYQQQTAMSDAMIAWHQTAVSMATLFVVPSSATSTGCSLTAGSTTPCKGNGVALTYIATSPMNGETVCSGSTTSKCMTLLPPGYQTTPYTFYSTVFSTITTPIRYYVVTYVPPPTSTLGVSLVCLPGGTSCTRLSVSFTGFASQLSKNKRISSYAYGTVANTTAACGSVSLSCLITPPVPLMQSFDPSALPVSQSLVYPLPSSMSASTNAIGIITEILPCSTCS